MFQRAGVVPASNTSSNKDMVSWIFRNMTNKHVSLFPLPKLYKLKLIYGVFRVAGKHDVVAQLVLLPALARDVF